MVGLCFVDVDEGREQAPAAGEPGLDGADRHASVRSVFSWSYSALGEEAARLFRSLGLHPDTEVRATAAASLLGTRLAQAHAALAELGRAHLVNQEAPDRFVMHDLHHMYAVELCHALDEPAARGAAVRRVLDHYLHTAYAGARLLHPTRDPITLATAEPGVSVDDLVDRDQAFVWFAARRPVLLAAIDQAAANGLDTRAWQLAEALVPYLDKAAHWHDYANSQQVALAAARRLADPSMQARTHRLLGRANTRLARFDDADTHLRQALRLYVELDDGPGAAAAHLDLGWSLESQGKPAEAITHAQAALRLFRAGNHTAHEARTLNSIGWCYSQLGDHRRAIAHCRQALALFETN
jgi:tetratricopeptide (TPR) repeat protein